MPQQPDVNGSKQRFAYVFDLSDIGFMQGSSVGHIPFTLLWERVLRFARVKRDALTEAKQQNNSDTKARICFKREAAVLLSL